MLQPPTVIQLRHKKPSADSPDKSTAKNSVANLMHMQKIKNALFSLSIQTKSKCQEKIPSYRTSAIMLLLIMAINGLMAKSINAEMTYWQYSIIELPDQTFWNVLMQACVE
jgi:hypothetical protein